MVGSELSQNPPPPPAIYLSDTALRVCSYDGNFKEETFLGHMDQESEVAVLYLTENRRLDVVDHPMDLPQIFRKLN